MIRAHLQACCQSDEIVKRYCFSSPNHLSSCVVFHSPLTERLYFGYSNSFKKTQPPVLLAKIDDRLEQYTTAIEVSSHLVSAPPSVPTVRGPIGGGAVMKAFIWWLFSQTSLPPSLPLYRWHTVSVSHIHNYIIPQPQTHINLIRLISIK